MLLSKKFRYSIQQSQLEIDDSRFTIHIQYINETPESESTNRCTVYISNPVHSALHAVTIAETLILALDSLVNQGRMVDLSVFTD